MNVLFVDDEVRVLEAMRRTMFGAAVKCDVFCAAGAVAALELMETTPIDVVVSDMRMPERDGAWLLTEVMQRYPECIRYVLSGQADELEATRAIRVTHKFLHKPVTREQMHEALASAEELLLLGKSACLRRVVGAVDMLPTLPQSIEDLRALVQSGRKDAPSAVAIIERDPVLAAKILQLARSSFFSRPKGVHDLTSAVETIGINLVIRMAALIGTTSEEAPPDPDVQRRAVHAARIADALSPNAQDRRAATAALLCDIGELVLERGTAAIMSPLERELFGNPHAEVGAYLLALWGLPKEIVTAVRMHHEPIDVAALEAGDTTAVVALAHLIADGGTVPHELRHHPAFTRALPSVIAAQAAAP